MDGQLGRSEVCAPRPFPVTNVRVLHGADELEAAVARAEDGARRLRERLEARAARDERTARHASRRTTRLEAQPRGDAAVHRQEPQDGTGSHVAPVSRSPAA